MPLIPDPEIDNAGGAYVPAGFPSAFADSGYCGRSFNRGLVRFHDAKSGPEFRELVLTAFAGQIHPDADVLAFDWQARQIVTVPTGEGVMLYLADVGSADVYELATPEEFAAVLTLDNVGEVFNEERFVAFRETNNVADAALAFTECVEFEHPLFLGGEDSLSNMAVTDTSVYWTIIGALVAKTANVPPGTVIGG